MRYLDTSVIRARGNGLQRLADRASLRTSVLAVIELIQGVTSGEKQYDLRSSSLRALMKSGVTIDWAMPEEIQVRCFSEITSRVSYRELRLDSLKGLVNAVIESSSLAGLQDRLLALKIDYPLDYFEQYDRGFGTSFINVVSSTNQTLNEAFAAARSGASSTLVPTEVIAAGRASFAQWFSSQLRPVNEAATVAGLARSAVATVGAGVFGRELKEEEAVGLVHDSYDGTISAFVSAFSMRAMDYFAGLSAPARNDALDLAHFLYLREGDELVTDDVALGRVGRSVGVVTRASGDLT